MKKIILTLIMANMIVFCAPKTLAGQVTVMWEFPTEREDGVLIKAGELSHTKVYFHDVDLNHWTEATVMFPDAEVLVDKPAGNYEIFATVVDSEGRESAPSNKVQKTITDTPVVIELMRTNPPTIIVVDN